MSLSLSLSDVFSWLFWGYWETTKVKCHSYHILSRTYNQNDVNFVNMLMLPWSPMCGSIFVRFPQCKVTLFPHFSYCPFLEEVYSSHFRSGDLGSIFLKAVYLHKLFGALLHWKFVYSDPFNLLLSHFLYQYGHSRYLFYIFGYNPLWLIYFVAQMIIVSCLGSSCWPLGSLEVPYA